MKIKHALQEYLLEIEVRKYTQKTIRSYRKQFRNSDAIDHRINQFNLIQESIKYPIFRSPICVQNIFYNFLFYFFYAKAIMFPLVWPGSFDTTNIKTGGHHSDLRLLL